MSGLLVQIHDTWRYGGVVMPALIATAFVLWFALGERVLLLYGGISGEAVRRGDRLRERHGGAVPRRFLDEAFADLEDRLHVGTGLVACLVAMAPLLGLLGTVTGLIETFGSLGASATSTASEGIAGGIVEALLATQMGLAIAVPGLLAGGALRHR
ncbi:MAG: MotA/TolQ/ExbB proton channel family protein, partial [Myxococcota bacterium]